MKKIILLTSLLALTILCGAQTAVHEDVTMTIGGIKQFIRIRGKDASRPLLLFLHGGPGGSVMGYAEKFTGRLQEHFVVVQWDQRETGKTKALNASPVPLTTTLFVNDTHEMIDSLLQRFHQPKLFLMGHSWGTYLGFQMAAQYPELLYAYIAIGPMIYQQESERIILQQMKDKAANQNDKEKLQALNSIKIPFESGEQLYTHRKLLFDYTGNRFNVTRPYVIEWSATWLELFNKASEENWMQTLPEVRCPIYFCIGRRDFQTHFSLVEKYYEQVKAPKKKLFWFEHSAHAIPSSEPERLQEVIIQEVKLQ
jgi:pimeloyl-ACP methyl ester carboxylesterase